ncbi:hypothetical protein [uncultured Imperialibacter sp.]|uniref:hypothetical protein n=1 Tax=Imperialibacter sp. TaxID=2038411 RepID=UPI0030D9C38D|tara:strand:+ start:17259 stop:17624 length:366 start_codon:yes stop_codon:yes gene_type:complete
MDTKVHINTFCALNQVGQVELAIKEGVYKCRFCDSNSDVMDFYQIGSFFVALVKNASEENEPIGTVKSIRAYSPFDLLLCYPEYAKNIILDRSVYHSTKTQSIFPEKPETQIVGSFKKHLN